MTSLRALAFTVAIVLMTGRDAMVFAQQISAFGPVRSDVSPVLRGIRVLAATPQGQERPRELRQLPPLPIPQGPLAAQADPQTTVSAFLAIDTPTVFDGIGASSGYQAQYAPPDTVGAAGTTQFVQWVNTSFAVFDKGSGAALYGPVPGSTLWRGFGGKCETSNDGDPVVLFDRVAQRWIMSQFSVRTTPYLQCIAVSTTADATGSYARYAYQFNDLNDYGKFGIWGDGYYSTYYLFKGNNFVGTRACGFNRAAMLTAVPAAMVCFDIPRAHVGVLPADAEGSTLPASSQPALFVGLSVNALAIWRFKVDWVTPKLSTVTGPDFIPVDRFRQALCGGMTCVPQPSTSQKLDTLGDRLMFRLSYRSFAGTETLVVTHSVMVNDGDGTRSGVRWYELRSSATQYAVAQSGTLAPPGAWRWMSSAALDKEGNLLVGYSVSSSADFPSARFAGRSPADPSNTLSGETPVLAGTRAQAGNRWGDYTSMTLDPTDDCTFWFTGQHVQAGTGGWSTFVARTRFQSCK